MATLSHGVLHWRVGEVEEKCNNLDNMYNWKKKLQYSYKCESDCDKMKIVRFCPRCSDNGNGRFIGWITANVLTNDLVDALLKNANVEVLT